MIRSLALSALITLVALVYGRPGSGPRLGRHERLPYRVIPPLEPTEVPEPSATVKPVLVLVEDLPTLREITTAAEQLLEARAATNKGSCLKRAADKVLARTPNGTYGRIVIDRKPSTRQTADLDEIARIFEQHGLGPIPMKTCAPTITISQIKAQAAQPIAA